MIVKPGQIEFPSGWTIHVHEIMDGEVFYQRFPPGVESQGMFTDLGHMPIYRFAMFFAAEDGAYVGGWE